MTFFNQLKELTDAHGCNFTNITSAVSLDKRIGNSHMKVPGPDGRRGFGGACFPKDTNAMNYFAEGQFDLFAAPGAGSVSEADVASGFKTIENNI